MSAPEAPSGANWFQTWAAKTPVVARWTIIGIVATSLLGLLGFGDLFANVPYLVLARLHLHRIVLAPLYHSLFSALFVLLAFTGRGPAWERQRGSLPLALLLIIFSLSGNAIYDIVALALMPIWSGLMQLPSSGLWGTLMGLIAAECFKNPDQERRMWLIPVKMKAKYFPLAMIAFFTLLSASPPIDMIIGVGLGYLYINDHLTSLFPTQETLDRWEACPRLEWFTSQPGYVPMSAAVGDAALPTTQTAQQQSQPSNTAATQGGTPWSMAGRRAEAAPKPKFAGKGQSLVSKSKFQPTMAAIPSEAEERRALLAKAAEDRQNKHQNV